MMLDTGRRKPPILAALLPKHIAMIRLMVEGHDKPHEGIKAGQPYTAIQAADAMCIRRSNARELLNEKVFVAELKMQFKTRSNKAATLAKADPTARNKFTPKIKPLENTEAICKDISQKLKTAKIKNKKIA
jgi:hypothetical protein